MSGHNNSSAGVFGGGYFLGFIGALVYLLQHATSFWDGILRFLEACVWPAFLVYHLFAFLKI